MPAKIFGGLLRVGMAQPKGTLGVEFSAVLSPRTISHAPKVAWPLATAPKARAPPKTVCPIKTLVPPDALGRTCEGQMPFSNSRCFSTEPSGFFTSMVQWPWTLIPSCLPFAGDFSAGDAGAVAGIAGGIAILAGFCAGAAVPAVGFAS